MLILVILYIIYIIVISNYNSSSNVYSYIYLIISIEELRETIKWKYAGDFVYVILYKVIYRTAYDFLYVSYIY